MNQRTAALALLFIIAGISAGRAEESSAEVFLGPERTTKLRSQEHSNHPLVTRTARFVWNVGSYSITYKACVDASHRPEVVPIEGYIGMPTPSSSNWYHSGFLFLRVNGKEIGRAPLSSIQVSETGDRAMVDLVWHHPSADVRVRFAALPGGPPLYVEAAIDPREPVKSIQVLLRCYPSFFTSWHHRVGARRIRTPSTAVVQGAKETFPAANHWWAVYYDDIFDVQKGEGDGPCGLVFPPDEPTSIYFDVGSYAVTTTLDYPPTTRRLHWAFWDFQGMENSRVLAEMPQRAEAALATLRTMDFVPEGLKTLDLDAIQADLGRAQRLAEPPPELRKSIARIQELLQQPDQLADAPVSQWSINIQERLLQLGGIYREFHWQSLLYELLAGI